MSRKINDECYTPEPVYEAVSDYVSETYGLDKAKFIRPFWPGADYQKQEYSEGCVVVDNPPFSFLSNIINFFLEHNTRFFLFAPTLSIFDLVNEKTTAIVTDYSITYANGLRVNTSFITNLEPDIVARSEPELFRTIKAADRKSKGGEETPKYRYPPEVLTSSMLCRMSRYGIEFGVRRGEAKFTRGLDGQRAKKKKIYGCGFLISEKAAAEKAAAEKAAVIEWPLSEAEQLIIKELGARELMSVA